MKSFIYGIYFLKWERRTHSHNLWLLLGLNQSINSFMYFVKPVITFITICTYNTGSYNYTTNITIFCLRNNTYITYYTGYYYFFTYTTSRGMLPYIDYTGMCGPKGCGFSAVLVTNKVSILPILVLNRVWFWHSSLDMP